MVCAIAPANQITTFDLDKLNRRLENAHPREILAWYLGKYPRLVQTTAFGVTGMVIIDTLQHFPQTLMAQS